MATVYAVASSKGGVGKTTTTVNLGATLASAGLSVAVVDGDIGMANLGDALGIEPEGATLHDVLAEDSETPVEDAVYEGPAGLAVVPGDTSIDGFRAAEPANLADVLDALDDYDYVLVDTGAGLSHDTVLPLGLADEVVLVSTTERDSLTDTEKTRKVVERLDGATRGVVLTRVDPDDPNAEEVAERLAADVIEAVPVDPVVRESMRLSDPLPSYAPGSPAASAYRALAGSLTDESIPTPDLGDEPADETGTDDADEDETDAEAAESDATDDTSAGGGVSSADDTDAEDAEVETEAEETGDSGERDDAEERDDADETDERDDAGDPSGLTDDDALAADTSPSDDPFVADSVEPDDESDTAETEETVFTTSLVEEAEPTDAEGSEETSDEESDAEFVETDETDDDDDDGGKGFLGRLLG
jgi:septum site-determining protein MinD